MKFRKQSLLIALASTIAVAGFVVTDLGHRTSPGALAQVHGREEELSGKWDCSECHGGFGESMGEACLECHATIRDQVTAGAGLHGTLDGQKLERCATCHGEHHGAGFRTVNAQSFALAGIADAKKFEHERVGHSMGGRHLEIECTECHRHADDGVLQKGELRFGGLSQGCVSCHEDPHQGRMALGCAECHDERDWKQVAHAPHDRVLPLIGGHAGLECRKCHAQEEPHALEKMGRKPAAPPRTCQGCHESPHRADFVAGVGLLTALLPGQSCGHCHLADQKSFRAPDIAVSPEEHARSRFLLDVPHDQAKCDQCHLPVAATSGAPSFAERFPGRGPDDCASCHQDVHGGQFDAGRFAGRGCVACHERQHWSPHAFTVATHERTAFPLTGSHLETECNSCHFVAQEDAARLFHGSPARCDGCHLDAHSGSFAPFAAELARSEAGTCARCHVTTTFSEIPQAGFDHSRWTGFALRDAHAQAKCESCHPTRPRADRTGWTFGRVSERFAPTKGGTATVKGDSSKGDSSPRTSCVRCHADPHSGLFDVDDGDAEYEIDRPRTVSGRTGCARCHSEATFKTETADFDHGAWTGFALDGAHEQAGCAACHFPLDRPDGLGRTTGRALGPACVDCHADPHGGQFRDAEDRIDCARCHGSADFSDLVFDHDLDSRFPLDETHSKVACADCHKPVHVREDREARDVLKIAIVRYRPLGTECADCHGAPTEPLRRRRGKHE